MSCSITNPNVPRPGDDVQTTVLVPPWPSEAPRASASGGGVVRRARTRRNGGVPRRGSVLILVVAVLVLLALIGTAYIATSSSDRSAAQTTGATAAVDTLAKGVVESVAGRVAAERVALDATGVTTIRPVATAYFGFDAPTSLTREDGLQVLAARVPFAPQASNAPSAAARPRWPFLSAPLNATETDPGFFVNPAPNAAIDAGSFGGTSTLNRLRWGLNEAERRGTRNGHNTAAIAAVTLASDGQLYPAFFTTTDGQTGYVIAADADGDGIADSGLVPLGGLPNPEFAGITFYYGLRVIDNNSAFNVNTAWTTGDDRLVAGTTVVPVRNNRLFPSAIGLKETTTPRDVGSFVKLDEFDGSSSGFDLVAYRAGRLGDSNPLQNRAIPVADVDPATGRPATFRRVDFAFMTQHELMDSQLTRRLDFPGVHGPPTGGDFSRFTPFTLAEQGQWAEGFVLAQRDPVDTYAVALSKRTPLEQLLPNSLYRLSDSPNASTFGGVIRSRPYPASDIGWRRPAPDVSNWFNDNFNYDVAGGQDPLTVLNLRPLVVASNPVSQAVRFKPLPLEAVAPADPAAGPRFDVMHPYVRLWRDPTDAPAVPVNERVGYAPGEIVYFPVTGRYYIQSGVTTLAANIAPNSTSPANTWRVHNGPVVPTKVDLNTAPFGDLWRAFYLTMSSDAINPNNPANTVSPFGAEPNPYNLAVNYLGMDFNNLGAAAHTINPATAATQHPQRMFRSSIKDTVGNTYLRPDQMVLLRAAQAAVNAEYLRSLWTINPSAPLILRDNVPSRTIRLTATINGTPTPVAATVFAAPRSVYITEVYVNTETRKIEIPTGSGNEFNNPGGYIAVELYNPFPFRIRLDGWRLQVVDRTAANSVATGRQVTDLFVFDASVFVEPYGTLVLENYDPSGSGVAPGVPSGAYVPVPATYRPAGSGLPAGGPIANFVFIPGLERVYLGSGPGVARGELVLTRPRNAGLAPNMLVTLPVTGGGAATLDAVPVDSIDLTAVAMGPADVSDQDAPAYAYHYARRTDGWQFVYPGRYTANPASLAALVRQQGLRVYDFKGPAVDPNGDSGIWAAPPVGLGTAANSDGLATYTGDGANIPGTFPIQIANIGFGGPNAPLSNATSGNNNRFPFGGFLRNLDVLQVPFISPVRIHAVGNPNVQYEVISLTQDAAFAEDTATDNNGEENIGRFTPIVVPAPANSPPRTRGVPTIDETSTEWELLRYGWASDILDHLTVRPAASPHLPHAAVRKVQGAIGGNETYTVASYPETDPLLRPQPVSPKPATFERPSPATAYDAGEQGLVNINTAPLPVLAAVPWVRNPNPLLERAANVNIARSIIAHREKNGPFRSLFDLNAVRIIDPNTGNETAFTLRVGGAGLQYTPPADPGTFPGLSGPFDLNFVQNLTNDNGDFSPLGDAGNSPVGVRPVPDPAFPGRRGNRNTDNSPVTPANPSLQRNPPGDFESQFLVITAVSNLLTTRSDTFTAYLVIEGWRDAGTPRATRVLQRRYAYILDRTGVSVGLPQPLFTPGVPAQSGVIRPDIVGGPRPDTTVRVSPIPVR